MGGAKNTNVPLYDCNLMYARVLRYCVLCAGVLLVFTAAAKLVSSLGNARLLQYQDPILGASFRHVFWFAGTLELLIALVCLFGRSFALKVALLAWLSTAFLVYRLGLFWVGYQRPCKCLGNLTDALHVPPGIADACMMAMLVYLIISSYAALFWLWWHQK
jgi:asparagine N-glycosylation enzyme membrane subunit Stt3